MGLVYAAGHLRPGVYYPGKPPGIGSSHHLEIGDAGIVGLRVVEPVLVHRHVRAAPDRVGVRFHLVADGRVGRIQRRVEAGLELRQVYVAGGTRG